MNKLKRLIKGVFYRYFYLNLDWVREYINCTPDKEPCSPGCLGWDLFNEDAHVERCDACKRYPDDETAAKAARRWIEKKKKLQQPPRVKSSEKRQGPPREEL